MALFINVTDPLGIIVQHGTQSVTGSLFATLLIILIFLVAIGLMFQIPLEFLSIIILPYCLACGSHYSSFVAPMGVILIYIATLITKNWLFK